MPLPIRTKNWYRFGEPEREVYPMYRIRKSIDVDFAHHVRGHRGPCINIHGHTWKFEVLLESDALDADGFVIDFKELKQRVLKPCHDLLDHGLAIGPETFDEVKEDLARLGADLVASREKVHGSPMPTAETPMSLAGAVAHYPGGIKVIVFPFAPTSELLASWLWQAASDGLATVAPQVRVAAARVYETLHPVEAVAEYTP